MSELQNFIPDYNMFLGCHSGARDCKEQTPLYSITLQILPQKRFSHKGVNCRWDKYDAESQQKILKQYYEEFLDRFQCEDIDCQFELSPNLGTMHLHAYFADIKENFNYDGAESYFRKFKMPNSKFQHLKIDKTKWSSASWLKYIHKDQ